MHKHHLFKRTSAALTLLFLMSLAFPYPAAADSQGFDLLGGQSAPQSGTLMSLTSNPGVIQEADAGNASSLVGVIDPDETPLNLQPGQTSVAISGTASALVSTLNGAIHVGDRIAPSALQGVGTKAVTTGWILGVAQGSLDVGTTGALRTTVTDAHGMVHTVYVARLPVLVKVSYYVAPAKASTQSKWIPAGLQELANSIAGRDVPVWEIVLSALMLIIGVVVAGMVVNSAIRGGVMAIGRQPIIRRTIVIKIIQSFIMAMLLLAAAVGVVVLLLRVIF